MADSKISLSAAEISKWGQRLAADDWAWVTWKYLLGDTLFVLLWLIFAFVFLSLFFPTSRKRLVISTGINVSGGTMFSAFLFTWLVASLCHSALFAPGPYAYWLHSLLGPECFSYIGDWTFKYMTLLGLIFN